MPESAFDQIRKGFEDGMRIAREEVYPDIWNEFVGDSALPGDRVRTERETVEWWESTKPYHQEFFGQRLDHHRQFTDDDRAAHMRAWKDVLDADKRHEERSGRVREEEASRPQVALGSITQWPGPGHEDAVDVALPDGLPLLAPAPGFTVWATNDETLDEKSGKHEMIHAGDFAADYVHYLSGLGVEATEKDGYITLGHLKETPLQPMQEIQAGDIIGYVGSTGKVSPPGVPHLHLGWGYGTPGGAKMKGGATY